MRSETLAAQAAWQHVRDAGATERLTTVNPGAIIGPALSNDHSYSLQAIQRLLAGIPAAPRLGFTFVDVRDVADLHIRALSAPAAGGERFIATDRFLRLGKSRRSSVSGSARPRGRCQAGSRRTC